MGIPKSNIKVKMNRKFICTLPVGPIRNPGMQWPYVNVGVFCVKQKRAGLTL